MTDRQFMATALAPGLALDRRRYKRRVFSICVRFEASGGDYAAAGSPFRLRCCDPGPAACARPTHELCGKRRAAARCAEGTLGLAGAVLAPVYEAIVFHLRNQEITSSAPKGW